MLTTEPGSRPSWLEIVAAVRPRLAPLEARQLDPARPDWPAAVAAPDDSTDPWHPAGPVVVAYGPGVDDGRRPRSRSPRSMGGPTRYRAGVTPRRPRSASTHRSPARRRPCWSPCRRTCRSASTTPGLLDVVLETRELVHARAPRQIAEPTLPHPTSTAFVSAHAATQFSRRVADMTDPLYLILEPGRTDTDEGLRARVADPVWFLTRQWQLGELQGEDASTPVVVTSAPQHVPITYDRSRPDLDPTVIPAEALLEAEPGDWWTIGRRVRLGRAAAPLLDANTRARFRLGALPAPYENLADEVDGRAVFIAGVLRGTRDLGRGSRRRAADRWSSSELDYGASFDAGGTALRARDHTGGDVDWFTVDGDPMARADHPTRASPRRAGR